MMIMRFFLIFFIKAYVVDTHLNCIDKSMQFNAIQMSTHNICLFKEVKKKYTGCNRKTMAFLDCALIGVCAVIRSNMVFHLCTLLYSSSKNELKNSISHQIACTPSKDLDQPGHLHSEGIQGSNV